MKHQLFGAVAICIAASSAPLPSASADAPQPALLQIAPTSSKISLGEPLILKYKITNPESRRVSVSLDPDERRWLSMKMFDASGHSVPALPAPPPSLRHRPTAGAGLDPNGHQENYVVVSQVFQPTQPGQYRLDLSTHLTYSWEDGDEADERSTDNQHCTFVVTVTAKDPERLHSVAEGFRQTALHEVSASKYQTAIKALFSMHDPECLPVWREIADDPALDPWRATDVMHQLAKASSTTASDILAEMQPIAPERWARTGTSPLDTLAGMRMTANPQVKQHIDQLFTEAGFPAHEGPATSAN